MRRESVLDYRPGRAHHAAHQKPALRFVHNALHKIDSNYALAIALAPCWHASASMGFEALTLKIFQVRRGVRDPARYVLATNLRLTTS